MATGLVETVQGQHTQTIEESGELLLVRYPSVASNAVCRFLGVLYESLPVPKIFGIKLSHLLFPLPTSPIPAVVYFWLKISGDKYVLTTTHLERRKFLTGELVKSVPLEEIAEIEITQTRGQVFYRAGDLTIRDEQGNVLLTLEGVQRPNVFKHNIMDARRALIGVKQSLERIQARSTNADN